MRVPIGKRDLLEGGVAPSGRNWASNHRQDGVQLQTAGAQTSSATKIHLWGEVDANIKQHCCIWMKLEKLQRPRVNWATWLYVKDNSDLRLSGFVFDHLTVHFNCLSHSDYGLSERIYVGNWCLHFPSGWLALMSSKKWLCGVITGGQLHGAIRKQYLPTFQIISLKVCRPVERRASRYWGPRLQLKII